MRNLTEEQILSLVDGNELIMGSVGKDGAERGKDGGEGGGRSSDRGSDGRSTIDNGVATAVCGSLDVYSNNITFSE